MEAANLPGIIARAHVGKVSHMLNVCTNIGPLPNAHQIIELTPHIYQSVGVHPLNAHEHSIEKIEEFLWTKSARIIAIGETGLDNFREPLNDAQIESFKVHIKVAKARNLPIILHMRGDVEGKCAELLFGSGVAVIGHCYGGSEKFAHDLLNDNPRSMISFAGNITYKSASSLRDVVKSIPIERILIETDAPYLAPEPHRGKPNESGYIINTLKKVAEIKELPIEAAAQIIFENSTRCLLRK